jgi:hypothetical protein
LFAFPYSSRMPDSLHVCIHIVIINSPILTLSTTF